MEGGGAVFAGDDGVYVCSVSPARLRHCLLPLSPVGDRVKTGVCVCLWAVYVCVCVCNISPAHLKKRCASVTSGDRMRTERCVFEGQGVYVYVCVC